MSEEKWIRQEILEIVIYLFFGALLFIILPTIGGFFLKGFQEEITTFSRTGVLPLTDYLGGFLIYFYLMMGAILVIIYPVARLALINRGEHPALQENPKWYTIFTVSLIHSPEENGALYRLFHWFGWKDSKNPMRWSLSIFRVLILSILLFGFLGIFQILFPQLNISGVPSNLQQISPASDVIFGAGVPSFTENGVLMLVFFFLLGLNAYICSRFKLKLIGFFTIAFFISIFMGFFWAGMHSVIYGNNETALLATFIFGFLGAILTLLFASFIWWMVWHIMNNAFIKLASVITVKEDLFFVALIVWFGVFLLYVFGEIVYRRMRRRFGTETVVVPD